MTHHTLYTPCRLIRTTARSQRIQKRVDWVSRQDKLLCKYIKDIELGAQRALKDINGISSMAMHYNKPTKLRSENWKNNAQHNMSVSFRISLSGLRISFIDSAPSELFVASLSNINAIGSYDWLQTTDSTFYFTISDLQVDNMIPNVPYLVAVSRLDSARLAATSGDEATDAKAPILVAGFSCAPKHESGITVRTSLAQQRRIVPPQFHHT